MPPVFFYLNCSAILSIVNAALLSLQAPPHGYNASSKDTLAPSGALTQPINSPISSKTSGAAFNAYNHTLSNDTMAINASSWGTCCFVVQDTIDVRYWAAYLTYTTVFSNLVTSHVTFATQYLDTVVTTNVSTLVRTLTHTSKSVETDGGPEIPNTVNDAPYPSLTQIGLNGSLVTTFGATITSPTQFYLIPSVNVIRVPAVFDDSGRPACVTTSTYHATCAGGANLSSALYITGINSNAERYFSNRSYKQGSAVNQASLDMVQVSFSKPFVYAPHSDPFPASVVNEDFGYVPHTLLDWMARDPDYVSKFPGLASCFPGGPSIGFSNYFCHATATPESGIAGGVPQSTAGATASPESLSPQLIIPFQAQYTEPDLTVSTTFTVTGKGCFHPGACPTPAAPGAIAVTATPEVTPEAEGAGASSTAQAQDTSLPTGNEDSSPSQALNRHLPAPAQTTGKPPVTVPETQPVEPPSSPGEVFTANPTAFSIDGTTISAGGPGVTVSGTPISLQGSGVLDIGNSTVTLSSAGPTDGVGLAAFTGFGDHSAMVSLYSVLASALGLLIIMTV